MAASQTYVVMLSGAYRELAEHRAAVRDALLRHHMFPVVMEHDAALPDGAMVDGALAKVDEAAAYVGLVGYRYGPILGSAEQNPERLSLTELEFRRAVARGIPVCMFIMHGDHPVPRSAVNEERAPEKLDAFLRMIKGRHTYAEFKSVDDLKAKAIQTLVGLRDVLDKQSASAAAHENAKGDSAKQPGRIFINYRRGDDSGYAGRLFDRLAAVFDPEQLFMDVDSIAAGQDFAQVLDEHVRQCDILLAIIGQNWVDARDGKGHRRLENPNDFVRLEIESGLKLDKRVIPVMVNNAEVPRADALPLSLRPLVRRNAIRISHDRFGSDAQGLITALKEALVEVRSRKTVSVVGSHEEEITRTETVSAQKDKARTLASAGLSRQDIIKAEELANWDFIKSSTVVEDFRDHLARFPNGVTVRFVRSRLEALAWSRLESSRSAESLKAFLDEFPEGSYAKQAMSRIQELTRAKAATNKSQSVEAQIADTSQDLGSQSRPVGDANASGSGGYSAPLSPLVASAIVLLSIAATLAVGAGLSKLFWPQGDSAPTPPSVPAASQRPSTTPPQQPLTTPPEVPAIQLFTIRSNTEAYRANSARDDSFAGVGSIAECALRCKALVGCTVFSYRRDTGGCFMYSRAELRENAAFETGLRK